MTRDDRMASLRPLVKQLRDEMGVTQEELGRQIGYGWDRISKYERSGPSVDALPRLARVARENGKPEIAKQFINSYLDEYPDLRDVLDLLMSDTPATPSPADKQTRELYRLVDRVVASGSKSAVDRAKQLLEIGVELSKKG